MSYRVFFLFSKCRQPIFNNWGWEELHIDSVWLGHLKTLQLKINNKSCKKWAMQIIRPLNQWLICEVGSTRGMYTTRGKVSNLISDLSAAADPQRVQQPEPRPDAPHLQLHSGLQRQHARSEQPWKPHGLRLQSSTLITAVWYKFNLETLII